MSNNEIWESIAGFEDSYEVSNHGRVRSLDRLIDRYGGKQSLHRGRILKQNNNRKGKGYMVVTFCNQCVKSWHSVHRLVANAFMQNPENLPCINHKDEDPSNNHVENLEWCTHKYNTNYGTAIERMRKQNEYRSKSVVLIGDNDIAVERFVSLREAARQLKIS